MIEKMIEKINENKSWFFAKKIDKPLARLLRKKWRELKSIKIRNEKR